MDTEKNNKKILEYKKIIKEQKKKIKLEKKLIKKRKQEKYQKSKFGKTFLGRFLGKIFFIFGDRDSYTFSELLAVTIVSIILGFFTCFSVFTIIGGGRNYFKVSSELGKIYDVYQVLVNKYNGKVDKNKLIDTAINGMVSSVGDVYTSYQNVDDANNFNLLVNGSYEGIGCTIKQTDDLIEIVEIYDNSPAAKAGLKVGDKIIKVDNITVNKDTTTTNLANYIKVEANAKIKMVVLRDNKELEFMLERQKVEIPSVVTKTFDKNDKKVGYIGISIFSSVTAKQFEQKLIELEKNNIDALVIDVRGNSGGYLSAVNEIASSLLAKGEIIYQTEKNGKKVVTKDKTATKRTYPIAILTDGGSASASEILAAAIKERYHGYVVGTKTYGKGTVQQVKELSDGSMIKYTTENWLTPDGNWINGVGIEPTNEVKLSEEYMKEANDDNDNQLQEALKLVTK